MNKKITGNITIFTNNDNRTFLSVVINVNTKYNCKIINAYNNFEVHSFSNLYSSEIIMISYE